MLTPDSSDRFDWFTLICGMLIGGIVGGMFALSFAPTMVTM